MCGIMALLNTSLSQPDALEIVADGLRRISHRGEEEFQGELWSMEGVAAGANRLPFTSGDEVQPVRDDSGRYQVLLNGEIYSLHGSTDHSGKPISDTKALANEIAQKGVIEAFRSNHGMYAVVVIDTVEGTAYLARDPFGIKPLYFAHTQHGLVVASEIKALAPLDFVEVIDHLPVGSVWQIAEGVWQQLSENSIEPDPATSSLSDTEYAIRLRQALEKSVLEQTQDSCRYGVYLSGGIDSASIYAIARLNGIPVVPFVLGTADAKDVNAARLVVEHFGDELQFVRCPSEFELFQLVEDAIRISESFEPNVVRQTTVAMVLAKGAKDFGCRVVLCGEGADELFGGYPEFWSPTAIFQDVRNSFLRDLHRTQLQRVDRANMAHTIEVRVPFLAPDIASLAISKTQARDFSCDTKGARAKLPLRNAMAGDLPAEIIGREKVVFSEGAGVGGNNPTTGLFSEIFAKINDAPIVDKNDKFSWNISTREEFYYLNIFKKFGYSKYKSAAMRVFANSLQTVVIS